MRPYRTEEYKRKLIGNTFRDSGSDYKQHDGKKVQEIIRELTDKDYDRDELSTDTNGYRKHRYMVNCMYAVKLEDGAVIPVYEDEINPEYCGDFEE